MENNLTASNKELYDPSQISASSRSFKVYDFYFFIYKVEFIIVVLKSHQELEGQDLYKIVYSVLESQYTYIF